MKLKIYVIVSLAGTSLASSSCRSDNCLRAVAGTRNGASFEAQATSDCGTFVGTTISPWPVTVTVTGTVPTASPNTTTWNGASTTSTWAGIPPYASACSGAAGYSSACSCIGILPTIATLPPWTITITVTVLPSATSTTPPSNSTTAPCNATNILTDPNNCGSCGNKCSSGTCTNGACKNTACDLATCGSFNTCGTQGACFCFSDVSSVGFCGQNAVCAGLTSCTTDAGCLPGYVCAINTCCGEGGVCLSAACDNPAKKLMRAAKRFHEGTLDWDTAAFLV